MCAGVGKCAQVFVEVFRSAWVSMSVCWMNFQNIFWRLESIHQRTLIRILYEFFFQCEPKMKSALNNERWLKLCFEANFDIIVLIYLCILFGYIKFVTCDILRTLL